MEFLRIFLSLLSIVTIALLFVRPKIGAILYVFYFFLAPHFVIGNIVLGTRTEGLIVLLAFFPLLGKTPGMVYKLLYPFFFFYGVQFLLLPFSFDVVFSFNTWMIGASQMAFFLFLLSLMYQKEDNGNYYAKYSICVLTVIVGYGLYLMTMPGFNPYLIIQQPIFGGEFNEAYAAGNSGLSSSTELADGRLFGRISSFLGSPQKYALVLGFTPILLLCYLKNKVYSTFGILICLIAIISCGVRTPIAAIVLTLLFVLLYYKKFKYFLYVIIATIVLYNFIPLISADIADYVYSIGSSDESSNVRGSTWEMRMNQFYGCLDIIKENPITGKGIGWTTWYTTNIGGHPKALYFESLLFSVLCNCGIIGIIIWMIFWGLYVKTTRAFVSEYKFRVPLYALFVYYISYIVITGDYGYMPMFVLFYVLIVGIINSHKTIA